MVHKPRKPETTRTLSCDEVAALEIFRDVAARRPELIKRVVVRRRHLWEGHLIFREGERGNTAFFIEEGSIALFASPPAARARGGLASLWDRFCSWMEGVWRPAEPRSPSGDVAPGQTASGDEILPQEISTGGPGNRKSPRVDVPRAWVLLDHPRKFHYRRPSRTLAKGALFDELTCLNAARERKLDVLGHKIHGDYPRPAAAQAWTDAVVLELDQAALLALREAGPLKPQLDLAMKKVTSEAHLAAGTPIEEAELATLEINGVKPFASVARLLADQPGSIVRRHFKKLEVICRQGEFGSTAFIIEKGSVNVLLDRHGPRVVAGTNDVSITREGEETSAARLIYTDSGDFTVARTLATLGEGEIFGEMTCMNFYPRSATVTAAEDCTLIEILRNVLDTLKRSGPYKDKLDADYRDRALGSHLRQVPIFSGLPDDTIAKIRTKAKFRRFSRLDKDGKELTDPEEFTVCREGDLADAFYLVRSGTVKVSRRTAGGEVVLPYLSRGDFFGEIGLLLGGARTATCQALDRVELVQIDKVDFDAVMTQFPDIQARLTDVALKRLKAASEAQHRYVESNLSEFVDQGLMAAQDLLVINLNACTRCDACVQACADTHGGVSRLPRDGARFGNYLITAACRSCRDPQCMIGCPVGSIRRKDSKEIVIENWCIGCGKCEVQCPYGSIAMHHFRVESPESQGDPTAPVKKQALGCDLCSGFPEPNCVHACPHDCALRVDPRRFFGGPSHRVAGRDKSWNT